MGKIEENSWDEWQAQGDNGYKYLRHIHWQLLRLCLFTWCVREKDTIAFQAKIKCLMDIFQKLFSYFPILLQVKTTSQQMLSNLWCNTHQNTRQHTKAYYRLMVKNKRYWVKFQSSQGKKLIALKNKQFYFFPDSSMKKIIQEKGNGISQSLVE